ncbi:hypothetical protein [Nonomuraea sp. NPDC050451]|uniref:hypothetical protein n=1 Tax=unclassified Nonomuraea TaxID=2593643 RepID=UPI0037A8FDB7
MSSRWRPGLIAGGSVLCGVTAGVLTNLVTSAWSWALAAALAVTVVCWIVLEIVRAGQESATSPVTVTQKVRRVAGRLLGIRGDASGVVRQRIGTVTENGEVIGYEGNHNGGAGERETR